MLAPIGVCYQGVPQYCHLDQPYIIRAESQSGLANPATYQVLEIAWIAHKWNKNINTHICENLKFLNFLHLLKHILRVSPS